MTEYTVNDWHKGIQRLLEAPQDLALSGVQVWPHLGDYQGSVRHQRLLDQYRAELEQALVGASKWWEMMIYVQELRVKDHERAVQIVKGSRPAGPASDPMVVGVVRKYWLQCDSLNREVTKDQSMPPQVFLLKWLMDSGGTVAAEVLSQMPYWPMGIDREGNWV